MILTLIKIISLILIILITTSIPESDENTTNSLISFGRRSSQNSFRLKRIISFLILIFLFLITFCL